MYLLFAFYAVRRRIGTVMTVTVSVTVAASLFFFLRRRC